MQALARQVVDASGSTTRRVDALEVKLDQLATQMEEQATQMEVLVRHVVGGARTLGKGEDSRTGAEPRLFNGP